MDEETQELLEKYCASLGVDRDLVYSIAEVESAHSHWAVRYEKGWKYFFETKQNAARLNISEETEHVLQACSWGILQVMGSVARELGFKRELPKLCQPTYGLFFGIKKLASIADRYDSVEQVIAAYNAGSARRTLEGDFVNQSYVDKVLRVHRGLKLKS